MHVHFRASKALKVSSGSDTLSNFLLAPSPERSLLSGLRDTHKSLYELLIVSHETEKGLNFCIGLGWCTFGDGSQIQIAKPHTFLRDSVCQIIYLFL